MRFVLRDGEAKQIRNFASADEEEARDAINKRSYYNPVPDRRLSDGGQIRRDASGTRGWRARGDKHETL